MDKKINTSGWQKPTSEDEKDKDYDKAKGLSGEDKR